MLAVGQTFPSFSLQDQNGETKTGNDLLGSPCVVYFYPKDDTTGCTAEACEFQSSIAEFAQAPTGDFKIFGVSPDPVKSHRKFADKYGLTFTLLADVDHVLCEEVAVWVEKSMYGKKYMGVDRTTFLLNSEGVVTKVYSKVKAQGHAEEVLKDLG